MASPLSKPLAELAAGLRAGAFTAADLAEEALAQQRLGAYHHVDPERTRAGARAADAAFAAGRDLGPLQGLPLSVKDLYGVPGFPIHAGSPARLPARFEAAGPLLGRALDQLAVVTGKTHTVEFAFGGVGTNPHYPTPRNPWDADAPRAPGGSSAGAGVSLAEGSAVVAFGTDTAGSVRIPAAWTGQVGMKTTKGRWSTEGIVPLSTTLDTPGVLTRTVADQIVAFRALDPAPGPLPSVALEGLRLGRCDAVFFEECSPGVAEAVEEALAELAGAGARVRPLELPMLPEIVALFGQGGPVSTELYFFLREELPDWYAGLDPNVQARIGDAGNLPAHEYLRRRARMAALGAEAAAALEAVDVLVTPTVANTPPRLDAIATTESYKPANLLCLRNTCVVSYLGLCALTLPCGRDAAGMPVGLQLVAGPHQEERLLAVARAIEAKLGSAAERLGAPPL
ncbi:MAG TPA: amidase [Polyangiaceae bacterium LLY-WYZ-15_(1-7)]|nr:2-amino-5-chloromuconate deaminase [Sandaracinus sp.]HJL05927.1 amidase [Polyangiaceae bacterium LLY-WYZ-15_(1-7)]MBJ72031.1 2-amino-5-chloromuconate deaminase [Sandaracinus sp.]HJL09068.1 amidase [Polyangiaceae bacterium LLY-WYZ-15_(1-7)]HJL22141.1 amidase [Polyangiaceae bacterium LLY-WYZ-15_(1-7)]